MADDVLDLKLPLSPAAARGLELGQIVTVSGMVFTGRSQLHIRAVKHDLVPPLDFTKINGCFHVGPVMRQAGNGWDIVSIEPTSSIRFERYAPDLILKLGLRTVLGKTTMGPRSVRALQRTGGVFLSKIGICGNLLRRQVRRVHGVHFLDELGKTEATWVFEVERMGPFFVAIDAHGHHYFDELETGIEARMPEVRRHLDIQESYAPTDVSARPASGNVGWQPEEAPSRKDDRQP